MNAATTSWCRWQLQHPLRFLTCRKSYPCHRVFAHRRLHPSATCTTSLMAMAQSCFQRRTVELHKVVAKSAPSVEGWIAPKTSRSTKAPVTRSFTFAPPWPSSAQPITATLPLMSLFSCKQKPHSHKVEASSMSQANENGGRILCTGSSPLPSGFRFHVGHFEEHFEMRDLKSAQRKIQRPRKHSAVKHKVQPVFRTKSVIQRTLTMNVVYTMTTVL